jgi:hypothetical protein
MAFLRKNFARGTLAADINDVVTQMTLTGTHSLPTSAGNFRLVIWDAISYPDPADDAGLEVVTASYNAPNVYDIVRAQEDTIASSHDAGDRVGLHYTAGVSQDDVDSIELNTTHRGSNGSDHSHVNLNNTHRGSSGSDHSLVNLNNTHRGSNGSDHSHVNLNTTHRGSDGSDHSKVGELEASLSAANEPTGFPNRTDSILSLSTRTFTITATGSTFDYWQKGIKYTVTTSDNVTFDDTNGIHVIYFDVGVLTAIANPSEAQFDDLIINKALVALVYWNTDGDITPVIADERHGIIMSGKTHHWLHDNIGSKWKSGLTASGYTLNTKADAALEFDLTNGSFYDEDIEIDIEDGSAANQYEQVLTGDAEIPVLYRDGDPGNWKEQAASTLPYINGGDNTNLQFNSLAGSTWGQTVCGNNKFMVYTLVATNDWQYPIKMIQGNAQYSTKAAALEGAQTEITAFGSLPSAEVVILYRFIMQTGSYTGIKNAQIVDVIDFRGSSVSGASATAQDHGSLSGLGDDDHAQYLRVDGERAAAFTDLTDVSPESIDSVDIGKIVQVDNDLKLDFVEPAAAGADEFTDLIDVTPTSIDSADIGKVVQVGDNLKLEFAEPAAGEVTLSAYTDEDSDSQTLIFGHAYKAATAGWVSAYNTDLDAGTFLRVYVGLTNDPAGAGDLIQEMEPDGTDRTKSVCALVAKDEYFEVTCSRANTVIRWKSFGTLSKPIDQD